MPRLPTLVATGTAAALVAVLALLGSTACGNKDAPAWAPPAPHAATPAGSRQSTPPATPAVARDLPAPAQEQPAAAAAKPGVGSWTMFRGDLANTGVSYSKRPAYKGIKWKYYAGAPLTSTPCVADGKVIAASEAGYVNCIDAQTGKKIWIHKCGPGELGKGIVFTSPMILDGRVYVGSKIGTLFCLDLQTGDEIFAFPAGEKEIYSSPKGDARGIVFATMDGVIWCLDPKDGKPRWKVEALREVGSTPAILGDTVYVPGKDRNLYEIDYTSGALRRKSQLPGTTHCTPALGAGYMFLVTGGRKSVALDLLEAKTVWENDATGDDQVAMGYAEGVAYFPLGQFLWAMDAPTGQKIWEFKAGHKIAAPCINGDDVVIAGRDRRLRVIDRKSGEERWSIDLEEGFVAGPVVVDGVVYLAGDANEGLHVFAVE